MQSERIILTWITCFSFHGSLAFESLRNLRFHICRTDTLMTDIKHGWSLLDCIYGCNVRSACKSFVYHAPLHMCGLYANDDEAGIKDCGKHLVWYGVKSDYPMTTPAGCTERICEEGSVCVKGMCRVLECAKIPDSSDVEILGNLDGIEKRRRIINKSTRQSYLMTCLLNGDWSQIHNSVQSIHQIVQQNVGSTFAQTGGQADTNVNSSPLGVPQPVR